MTGIRSWLWAVLCAAGLAATASAAPADVGYAPPGSDLIVRINGPKIFRSQTLALLRHYEHVKRFEADMRSGLTKYGMSADDLLNTDIFLFCNTGAVGAEKPLSFCVIARNRKAFAPLVLDYVSEEFGDEDNPASLKKDPICGKAARVCKDEDGAFAAVALADDLVWLQYNSIPTALPTPHPPDEVGRMVDSEAMIGIAFRNQRGLGGEILEMLPPVVDPLLRGVTFVKAHLFDRGNFVAIEAELLYFTPELAQNAVGQFNGMLLLGAMASKEKHPERVGVLRKFKTVCEGNKVVIRFSCRNDELARAFLK